MTTRNQRREILHNLFMLFDNDDDAPIFLCFEHETFRSVGDVIGFDPSMISELSYIPKEEPSVAMKNDSDVFKKASPKKPQPIRLELQFQVQIKIIQGYISHMEDIGQTIHDYQLITQQQIDQYRTSNNYKVYIKTGIPQQHKANYPPSDEDPTLAAFKRGIKRDPTHFNSFKRDSDWDDWEAHIRITATGQGVEEILDNNYVPKNKDDKTLFLEKQKYMFQVFHTKVHTDKGKELIRQHLKDFDAQEVFHQLKIHGDKSISAKIKASDLLTYITSSNIADGSWRGTTIGYITHWKEQIRLYHKKLEPGEFFSDDQKRTMLQNAVQQIPEL